MQRQTVTVHHPERPFQYLGVDLTMNLSWSYHKRRVLREVSSKAREIKHQPFATTAQKLYMLDACARAKATAFMQVVHYTPGDLELLDSTLSTAAKKVHRLTVSTPSAVVRELKVKLGMGMHSVAVEYHTTHQCWHCMYW